MPVLVVEMQGLAMVVLVVVLDPSRCSVGA
jgi:hypothetical protein